MKTGPEGEKNQFPECPGHVGPRIERVVQYRQRGSESDWRDCIGAVFYDKIRAGNYRDAYMRDKYRTQDYRVVRREIREFLEEG